METIAELIQRAPQEFRDAQLFNQLDTEHRRIFGTALCCLQEVESAIIRFQNWYKQQNTKKMSEQKYILKDDALIYNVEADKYFVKTTITDEEAIYLLTKSPSLIEQFEIYPADWQQQTQKKSKKETTQQSETATVKK